MTRCRIIIKLLLICTIKVFTQNSNAILSTAFVTQMGEHDGLGLQLKIGYYKSKSKHGFFAEYQSSYIESKGIFKGNETNSHFVIRSKNNPQAHGLSTFEFFFDKNHLIPKPDKFTNYSLSAGYVRRKMKVKSELLFLVGPTINYHYEVFINKIVSGKYRFIAGNEIFNVDVPIYEYSSYYELGLTSSFYYQKHVYKKIYGGFYSSLYLLPESKVGLISLGGMITVKL